MSAFPGKTQNDGVRAVTHTMPSPLEGNMPVHASSISDCVTFSQSELGTYIESRDAGRLLKLIRIHQDLHFKLQTSVSEEDKFKILKAIATWWKPKWSAPRCWKFLLALWLPKKSTWNRLSLAMTLGLLELPNTSHAPRQSKTRNRLADLFILFWGINPAKRQPSMSSQEDRHFPGVG